MKGIILAGGTGSRLHPLTKVTNKHLLPVGKKPMILHAVDKLWQADIYDIMVVTGVEHMGAVVSLLGSGKDYGAFPRCKFTYKVQDEAGGIAQALGLCEAFVGKDTCCVILGDNIFTADLRPLLAPHLDGAKILLKRVTDPQRYGVAELTEDNLLVKDIVEKPSTPRTDLAVTGIYQYNSTVFSVIKELKPSKRNELEITDVNNFFVKNSMMQWGMLEGEWTDAGTFDSLLYANQIAMMPTGPTGPCGGPGVCGV